MVDHKRIVDDFQRAMFEQHDPKAVADLYTEDAIYSDPSFGEAKGREAIEQAYQELLQAFPDVTAELRSAFGAGNMVASELRVTGTHKGPLNMGDGSVIPETGRKFELDVCWIGRVDDTGHIAEDRTYYDVHNWLQQLGLVEEDEVTVIDEAAAA